MTTTTQPDRNALPHLFPQLSLAATKRASGKTSAFSVQLAGHLVADRLWEAPSAKGPWAPVWMAYLGSPAESTAFTANLRASRIAELGYSDKIRLPRRSGHRFTQHLIKHQGVEAALTTAYLPELFRLAPTTPLGVGDPVRFVFAPPRWWINQEAQALANQFGDNAAEAAEAALFVAFIDRRIHLPIADDLRFHLAIYRAAREADWLTTPDYERSWNRSIAFGAPFSAIGIDTVLVANAPQRAVIDLIRELTHQHQEEIQNGTTRIQADCRLLQDTADAARQLCFHFEAA